MSDLKAPGWSRAAQIGLGAIAIILSILIIAFPGIGMYHCIDHRYPSANCWY